MVRILDQYLPRFRKWYKKKKEGKFLVKITDEAEKATFAQYEPGHFISRGVKLL